MSEASNGLGASAGYKVGPDYFGYYTREVAELLFQDEDFFPASQTYDMGRIARGNFIGKDITRCDCDLEENNCHSDCGSLFCNAIGYHLSDYKMERLKTLLRQSVGAFTQEVDEVIDPVVSMRQTQSYLRYKKSLLSNTDAACERDVARHHHKKHKLSSTSSTSSISQHAITEANDDLQYLLENYSTNHTKVEEKMKKYSDELSRTLSNMEQKIEELLNTVMSSCRKMTHAEKQRLRTFIQNLPPSNLNHVVGIVQQSRLPEEYSSEEILVDLDKEDNVTLWRLYYYVKTVENARKLCIAQPQENLSINI